MTTFYNFTLEIETSSAKKVVKSILEIWNVKVIVFVWFIYFWKKTLKISNVKKNNFKCTEFTRKTKIIQIESKIKSTA